MTPLLATVLGVAVAVVVIVLVARSRRSRDTVDSFRRGLDALSPEARRPVIDQIQKHHDVHGEPVHDAADGGSAATGGTDSGDSGRRAGTGDPDTDPDTDPGPGRAGGGGQHGA